MKNSHFKAIPLILSGIAFCMMTTADSAAYPISNHYEGKHFKTLADTSDADFAMKAAAGGLKEIEAGKIASNNASSDRVKKFAEMMISDHSKANEELKALASKKGISLPASLPQEKQADVQKLQQINGSEFDKQYMNMMVADHEKTIALFEQGAANAKDEEIREWAKGKLPALKMHLKSAQEIAGSL